MVILFNFEFIPMELLCRAKIIKDLFIFSTFTIHSENVACSWSWLRNCRLKLISLLTIGRFFYHSTPLKRNIIDRYSSFFTSLVSRREDLKGTVSRKLRPRLLYIIKKLFSRPIIAGHKILILLKGQFTIYIKQL